MGWKSPMDVVVVIQTAVRLFFMKSLFFDLRKDVDVADLLPVFVSLASIGMAY